MTDKELKQLQATELGILEDFHKYCKQHNLRYYLIGGALLGAERYKNFIPWDDDIDVGMPRDDYEKLKEVWERDCLPMYFLQHEKSDPLFSRAIMKLRREHTCILERSSANVKIHNGIYIDIFPIDYLSTYLSPKITFRAKMVRWLMSIRAVKCGYQNKRHVFLKKCLKAFMLPISVKLIDVAIHKLCTRENHLARRYAILYTHNYEWRKQIHKVDVFGQGTVRKFCGKEYFCPNNTDEFLRKVFGEHYMDEPAPEKRRNPHNYIYIRFSDGAEIGSL